MGSSYFVSAVPSLSPPLNYRSCTPTNSAGLRNSQFVTQRRVLMEATKRDVMHHDKQLEEEEHMLAAAGLRAEAMPKHVAVITDGHRRWARQRGHPVEYGHRTLEPVNAELCRLCCKFGIKVLTIYLFSTETWLRSQEETDSLMSLFEEAIRSNLEESIKHDIRISVIGDRTRLPQSLIEVINEAEEKTRAKSRLHLILGIGYGGQNDVIQACKKVFKKVKDGSIREEEINEKIFEQELQTSICTENPFPDLLIRAAGELRLSNFYLYQAAYAELYFTKAPYPDFKEEDMVMALKSYQQRRRRYGR
ncbi:hypothetical protein DCAR_0103702 [Daucus carota subsp. sativus]|uniref:Alkyl transferase n=2 Tax=Daucus carota subsp. sativus TaxID=79200 RepID=A0AAF0WAE9_DAUCS|nr:hypothetical protein DCAR_0103702 [Daucus carota subsp. sativus]